jgi:hypothetical protein
VTKRISPSVVTIICGRVVGPQDQRTLAPGEGYLGLYCSMTIRASTTRRNAARRLPSLSTARRQSGIGHSPKRPAASGCTPRQPAAGSGQCPTLADKRRAPVRVVLFRKIGADRGGAPIVTTVIYTRMAGN